MKFCAKCGAELQDDMAFCPKCGTPVEASSTESAATATTVTETSVVATSIPSDGPTGPAEAADTAGPAVSPKSRLAALLFGIFLGRIGVHNFYLGQIGRGVAKVIMDVFAWILYVVSLVGFINSATYVSRYYHSRYFFEYVAGSVFGFFIFALLILAVSIWSLVEWIVIACGKEKDSKGRLVTNWTN